jgi:CO dehydrogenase/acetyl-CoA synthase gamma subunit (corrinoid Fe-S protein)
MLLADAYVDRIDFLRYLPQTNCSACKASTCKEFVEHLREGRRDISDCPFVSEDLYCHFAFALKADKILPRFSCLTVPKPGPVEPVEINAPLDDAPVIVSGNHLHTQNVLLSVLATTRSPFFLLFSDTEGNTLDMAVIYKSITAEQIKKDADRSGILSMNSDQEIIIPGLAGHLRTELEKITRTRVLVGPVCAAELPLFLAPKWLPAGDIF